MYDQLADIETTLETCQEVKSHPLLTRMKEIVTRYKPHAEEYKEVDTLFTMVKRVAVLIDPDNFTGDSEEKRKRRLMGYVGYVAKVKKEHPELAVDLDNIIKGTKSFLPGLFAYFRCPGLPVTNCDQL